MISVCVCLYFQAESTVCPPSFALQAIVFLSSLLYVKNQAGRRHCNHRHRLCVCHHRTPLRSPLRCLCCCYSSPHKITTNITVYEQISHCFLIWMHFLCSVYVCVAPLVSVTCRVQTRRRFSMRALLINSSTFPSPVSTMLVCRTLRSLGFRLEVRKTPVVVVVVGVVLAHLRRNKMRHNC